MQSLIQKEYNTTEKPHAESKPRVGKMRMIIPLKLKEPEKSRYNEVREYRKKYGVPMFSQIERE